MITVNDAEKMRKLRVRKSTNPVNIYYLRGVMGEGAAGRWVIVLH